MQIQWIYLQIKYNRNSGEFIVLTLVTERGTQFKRWMKDGG